MSKSLVELHCRSAYNQITYPTRNDVAKARRWAEKHVDDSTDVIEVKINRTPMHGWSVEFTFLTGETYEALPYKKLTEALLMGALETVEFY